MRLDELDTLVVFDTETTGVDLERDRIVTAFIGVMDRSGALLSRRSWLIDPGIPIPERASEVHGISTEHARAHGVAPEGALAEIAAELEGHIDRGIPIVAYNAPFDLTLLDRERRRHLGLGFPDTVREIRAIDPLVIDKHIDRYRKGKRTLTAAAEHYGVLLDGAHDAEADAVATGRVAVAVLERLSPKIALDALHAKQVEWHIAQARSLQAWLQRKDPTVVVDEDWPQRPFSDDVALALA